VNTPAPKGFDPREWESWDQKSKDKLLHALQMAEKKKKVWYCDRGRKCDGEPHGAFDYGHARGDQWPPPGDDWLVWLLKGGRGSGKTRAGAEWTRKMSESIQRVSIIGPTLPHVRDVMVEGDSGLLAVFEYAKTEALWEPSKRRITIPCKCKPGKKTHTGDEHYITAFTGVEPERLRGPQHGAVWLDEPAHFALIEAVWDNMMFGLRLGQRPVVLCSTTPLPTKWMKALIAEPDTRAVTVSTYANLRNLAPTVRKTILSKYEGTRLGRQELYGEVLEDIEGALWTWDLIEAYRSLPDTDEESGDLVRSIRVEDMDRIVVAIDPAGTSSKRRDETGIVVVGKKGTQFYVLADRSGHYTPEGWAREAWKAFDEFNADKVIAEKNYGGEMVSSTLRNSRPNGPVDLVTSRRGKVLRAEPVVALYEQGRVHHFEVFGELETQMCEWVPDKDDSPDRVDALVHGITSLSVGSGPSSVAVPRGDLRSGGGGGFRENGGMLFGYKPRPAISVDDELEAKMARLAAMDRVFAPREMPFCEHPLRFESHEVDGEMICMTCLHPVEWSETHEVWYTKEQAKTVLS
jgi:phage terminase large subunit-like protein